MLFQSFTRIFALLTLVAVFTSVSAKPAGRYIPGRMREGRSLAKTGLKPLKQYKIVPGGGTRSRAVRRGHVSVLPPTTTKEPPSTKTEHTTKTTPHTTKTTPHTTKTTPHTTKTTGHTTKTTEHSTKTTEHSTKTTEHSTKTTEHSTKTTEHSTKTTEHSTKTTPHSTKTTEHTTKTTPHSTKTTDHAPKTTSHTTVKTTGHTTAKTTQHTTAKTTGHTTAKTTTHTTAKTTGHTTAKTTAHTTAKTTGHTTAKSHVSSVNDERPTTRAPAKSTPTPVRASSQDAPTPAPPAAFAPAEQSPTALPLLEVTLHRNAKETMVSELVRLTEKNYPSIGISAIQPIASPMPSEALNLKMDGSDLGKSQLKPYIPSDAIPSLAVEAEPLTKNAKGFLVPSLPLVPSLAQPTLPSYPLDGPVTENVYDKQLGTSKDDPFEEFSKNQPELKVQPVKSIKGVQGNLKTDNLGKLDSNLVSNLVFPTPEVD